jgi:hypothetical protein
MDIHEGLDDYQHSLREDDIDYSLQEIKYYREEYQLNLLEKCNEGKMENAGKFMGGRRFIQGVHVYDILRNPIYRRMF